MLLFFGGQLNAHQFTPTYPKLEPSMMSGILEAKMELFNKRQEVEYYVVAVYDADWNHVPFATTNKLIHIKYLETKRFSIYIREKDKKRAVYICTTSKLKKEDTRFTVISSRICSKIK